MGNDVIRPGTDPDDLAERFEKAVTALTSDVGTVVLTTGFDTRGVPVLKHLRGKVATYNGHVRAIADRYGCPVLDLWSLRSVQDRRAWDADRLHLSAEGHTRVALRAGQILGVEVPADPDEEWPTLPPRTPLDGRRDDIQWAREYLVPWIGHAAAGRLLRRPRQRQAARPAAALSRGVHGRPHRPCRPPSGAEASGAEHRPGRIARAAVPARQWNT